MSADPWTWSVDQVQTWLLKAVPRYVKTLPCSTLPDLDVLAKAFRDLGVNGCVLLTMIDAAMLREQLSIRSLAEQFTILSAISATRKGSTGYQAHQNESPMLMDLTEDTSRPTERPQEDLRGPRSNETFVEDSTGRKRRKLVLLPSTDAAKSQLSETPANPAPAFAQPSPNPAESAPNEPEPVLGYIRDNALTLDDIFYGDIALGAEIPSDDSDDEDEINITGQATARPGDIQYVYAQIKHLMQSKRPKVVKYQNKDTSALFPYRQRLLTDGVPQSLTVFRDSEKNSSAIRVDSSQIQDTDDLTNEDSGSRDGWDYLLKNYYGNVEEFGAYDGDSVSGVSSDFAAELEADEADAAESRVNGFLDEQEIEAIITDETQLMVSDWQENKLPRLESGSAYTTWRKAGKSRWARARYISGLSAEVQRLESRLQNKFIREMTDSRMWSNAKKLRAQCTCLEPTVTSIEELKWKIDVCKRKTAPPHESRQRAPRLARGTSTGNAVDVEMTDDFIVPDDNLHEPDMSDHEQLEQFEQASLSNSPAPEPVAGADIDSPTELNGELHKDDERPDSDMALVEETGNTTPEEEVPTPNLDDPSACHSPDGVTARGQQGAHDVQEAEFPPERLLVRSQTSSPVPDATEVIEISSDEHPTPIKPKKKVVAAPGKWNLDDIKGWSWEELDLVQDRKRFIYKLLFTIGSKKIAKLFQSLVRIQHKKLPEDLNHFIERPDDTRNSATNRQMIRWAKLYTCWFHCTRHYWDVDFDAANVEGRNKTDMQLWSTAVSAALPRLMALLKDEGKEISSDDLDISDESVLISHRKRKIKTDKSAEAHRKAAQARLAAHEKQSNNADAGGFGGLISADGATEVVVNLVRDKNEDIIRLHPHLAANLKPHQIGGLQFMWRETMSTKNAEGCLLAHTMGLGKTAQAITLLVTIQEAARNPKTRSQIPRELRTVRALILTPPTLIDNWYREIGRWTPPESALYFPIEIIDTTTGNKETRIEILERWEHEGGILLLGYNLFASMLKPLLQEGGPPGTSTNKNSGRNVFTKAEFNKVSKILLERPNVVIADEAHCFKSDSAQVSKLAKRFTTRRRVALTGSPLSNNTLELYALVSWVSPNFLGPSAEFKYDYANPIEAGLYQESTTQEKRRSLVRLRALRKATAPKVHRLDVDVLKGSLPSKTEFVLFVPLTPLQEQIYTRYMQCAAVTLEGLETISQTRLFGWLSVLKLLCNHPKAFQLRFEALLNKQSKNPKKAIRQSTSGADSPITGGDSGTDDEERPGVEDRITDLGISEETVRSLLSLLPRDMTAEASNKVVVVKDIVRFCKQVGDKVLFFSQSLQTLDLFEEIFSKMNIRWGRIDGSKTFKLRDQTLKKLRYGALDVVLISTRAGGVGLNIQEANRVIIFDFSFNPQWEAQAIGRAYRLGQQKNCFVYRFVAGGTFEHKLYHQGLFKTTIASRVIDSKNPARNAKKKKDWLTPPEKIAQENIQAESGKDAKVMDAVIALQGPNPCIRDIKTMETLTREEVEEPLNADEQREADNLAATQLAARLGLPQPHSQPTQPLYQLFSATQQNASPATSAMNRPVAPVAPIVMSTIATRSPAPLQIPSTAPVNGAGGNKNRKRNFRGIDLLHDAIDSSRLNAQRMTQQATGVTRQR